LSKHTAMAKAKIKSLFYKNEHSLLFEKWWRFCQSHFLLWISTWMRGTQNARRWKVASVYSDAGHGSGSTDISNCVTVCEWFLGHLKLFLGSTSPCLTWGQFFCKIKKFTPVKKMQIRYILHIFISSLV
jgi:hypothetical protein